MKKLILPLAFWAIMAAMFYAVFGGIDAAYGQTRPAPQKFSILSALEADIRAFGPPDGVTLGWTPKGALVVTFWPMPDVTPVSDQARSLEKLRPIFELITRSGAIIQGIQGRPSGVEPKKGDPLSRQGARGIDAQHFYATARAQAAAALLTECGHKEVVPTEVGRTDPHGGSVAVYLLEPPRRPTMGPNDLLLARGINAASRRAKAAQETATSAHDRLDSLTSRPPLFSAGLFGRFTAAGTTSGGEIFLGRGPAKLKVLIEGPPTQLGVGLSLNLTPPAAAQAYLTTSLLFEVGRYSDREKVLVVGDPDGLPGWVMEYPSPDGLSAFFQDPSFELGLGTKFVPKKSRVSFSIEGGIMRTLPSPTRLDAWRENTSAPLLMEPEGRGRVTYRPFESVKVTSAYLRVGARLAL